MTTIYTVPLPASVRDRLAENTHPGLLLDKYVPSWSSDLPAEKLSAAIQGPTIREVARLSQAAPAGMNLEGVLAQRTCVLKSVDAIRVRATTSGPLTLHLSRSSALENAGICLHRIYGFAYLPGTGIKGLVRAYAETIWLPTQPDRNTAWKRIEDVFGWAPNPDRMKMLKDNPAAVRHREFSPSLDSEGKPKEQGEHSGRVTFHDAWPLAWPKLQADILNSHHAKYYGGPKDDVPPPGDWEEPIPVYFLTVAAGTPFDFAVSARRSEDCPLADLAGEWLVGALENFGAGAKTNAGYGSFRVEGLADPARAAVSATWNAAVSGRRRIERTFTLTLATPAFLAGANPEDPATCDLRVATLRGQLRSWWRTLHAAHLSPADLRRLESAIWGNTVRGGAVRITVSRAANASPLQPKLFDRRGIVQSNHLPAPPNNKTTQGLTYASYGMDEIKDGKPSRRPYLEPGASWTVTLVARPSLYVSQEKDDKARRPELTKPMTAEEVAGQAFAAIELLCRLGGVGSKSRKGFGNFRLPPELPHGSLSERKANLIAKAQQLRKDLELKSGKSESPALDRLIAVDAVTTPWVNYWVALDRVGDSAQAFAQSKKHHLEKKALGLPRNVRAPYSGSFQPHKSIGDRHASPLHFQLSPAEDGRYVVQLVAFPADRLPTFDKSREFLTDALQQIHRLLLERVARFAYLGQSSAVGSRNQAPLPPVSTGPKLPAVGDRVACRLSAEKTAKGGWKASFQDFKSGPVQNTADVPADKKPGDEVTLIVRVSKPTEMAFRWPTPADDKPIAKR